jgi:hypothetical protein
MYISLLHDQAGILLGDSDRHRQAIATNLLHPRGFGTLWGYEFLCGEVSSWFWITWGYEFLCGKFHLGVILFSLEGKPISEGGESARDSCFGLYASVGELEVEAMINEAKISDMETEVRRLQTHEMNTDTRRQREQHTMEERRSQAEKKIKNVDDQYQVALNTWNTFRERIMSIHEELGLSV